MEDICKMIKSHKDNKGCKRFTLLTKNMGEKVFTDETYPRSISWDSLNWTLDKIEDDGDRRYAWYDDKSGVWTTESAYINYSSSLALYEDGELVVYISWTCDDANEYDHGDYSNDYEGNKTYISSESEIVPVIDEFLRSMFDEISYDAERYNEEY